MSVAVGLRRIAVASFLALAPFAAAAQPLDQRDHVWAVDQDGRETPLYGCWRVVSATHPASTYHVGDAMVFPAARVPWEFRFEGVIRGPDGLLWTRVALDTPNTGPLVLLERIDTDTNPQHWYVLGVVGPNGNFLTTYAETADQFAGVAGDANLAVFERTGCPLAE